MTIDSICFADIQKFDQGFTNKQPHLETENSPLEKIASIDIGSNTLRLLIAEKSGERIQALFRDREIVRLGRNFYPEPSPVFTGHGGRCKGIETIYNQD